MGTTKLVNGVYVTTGAPQEGGGGESSLFFINLSVVDGAFVGDKTYAEMKAAFQAGKQMVLKTSSTLEGVSHKTCLFGCDAALTPAQGENPETLEITFSASEAYEDGTGDMASYFYVGTAAESSWTIGVAAIEGPFVITQTWESGEWSCDKTNQEVIDAIEAEKTLVLCQDLNGTKLYFTSYDVDHGENDYYISFYGIDTTMSGEQVSPNVYAWYFTKQSHQSVEDASWEQYETSVITSSLTSSSTNSQAAGAKAVYDGLALKAEKTTSQALTFTAGGANPYTLDAGKIYTLDASTATGAAGESITFSLPASPVVTDIFDIQITIGATAPTINWPASITWAGGSAPTIAASKKYEVNICNNLAVAQEF